MFNPVALVLVAATMLPAGAAAADPVTPAPQMKSSTATRHPR